MAGSLRSRTQPRRRAASGTGSAARVAAAVAATAPTTTARRRRRARALAREVDAAERLGVRVPMRFAEVGRALTHAAFRSGEVPKLARVTPERLELPPHRARDVDDDIRL